MSKADLSGFTALTEIHGDVEAADRATGFSSEVRELLAEYSAEAIKTIGDAVMIRCPDAGATYHSCSLRCVGKFAADPGSYATREADSPLDDVPRQGLRETPARKGA